MANSEFLKCPITNLAVNDYRNISTRNNSGNYENQHTYSITINTRKQVIILPFDCLSWSNDSFFAGNKHLIAGLLLNEQLFKFNESYAALSLEFIRLRFDESIFPRTPQEKYDNLIHRLFQLQKYEGEVIDIGSKLQDPCFYYSLFFKTGHELKFYIETLQKDGLIDIGYSGRNKEMLSQSNVTYKGLSYVIKMVDEGKQSSNCFIAMSFGSGMGAIRNAIKEACLATGYIPVLVDEVHIDSDATINDAIIANLKKSRFCIADFTEQKDGVYFESGFALGQGKQVIYTCQKDDFNKSHFDTNHFPHIVYEDAKELKKKLTDKIEAWIR